MNLKKNPTFLCMLSSWLLLTACTEKSIHDTCPAKAGKKDGRPSTQTTDTQARSVPGDRGLEQRDKPLVSSITPEQKKQIQAVLTGAADLASKFAQNLNYRDRMEKIMNTPDLTWEKLKDLCSPYWLNPHLNYKAGIKKMMNTPGVTWKKLKDLYSSYWLNPRAHTAFSLLLEQLERQAKLPYPPSFRNELMQQVQCSDKQALILVQAFRGGGERAMQELLQGLRYVTGKSKDKPSLEALTRLDIFVKELMVISRP